MVVNNQAAENFRYSIYHDDVDGSTADHQLPDRSRSPAASPTWAIRSPAAPRLTA